MSFADLGLSDELLRAVGESGYAEPTPIQSQAIPSVLMGRDLIGIAQTGTGKTAAFVLPMIDILGEGRSRARMPRSLILEPTRELAAQVSENFEKYGKYHKLSMALLIGGTNMTDQIAKLEKGVDVLIATPGRLMDLFGRGKILLTGCNLLVIDEADRMLDMGFIPDIEEICSKLPKQRQTLLFSATMPAPIKRLADKFLSSPKSIEAARAATANASIDQRMVRCDARSKKRTLERLLRGDTVKTAIIFSNRKTTVRDLATSLRRDGFAVGPIHGDMEQPERLRELDRFKSGEINILVASDVAARGLDIKGVSHVFNYDVPWQPDDYIHRIGRTGRAGATGIAITLVTKEDADQLAAIEKLKGAPIPLLDGEDEPSGDAPSTDDAREAAPSGRRGRGRSKDSAERAKAEPKARDRNEPPPEREREREGRPERGARLEPEARPAREPRREREARPDREPRPERAPRAEHAPRSRAEQGNRNARPRRHDEDDGPDEGWNGPVPSFLSQRLD